MKKNKKKPNLGRDSTHGKVSFRTGTQPTRKDRTKKRNDKYAKKALKDQLDQN